MKIAFLLDSFPVISETFILDQITGMIDKGIDVYIISRTKPRTLVHQIHKKVHKYHLLEKTIYINFPQHRFQRIRYFFMTFIKNLKINPKLTLSSINIFKFKQKAISLYLFYHIEPFLKEKFDILHAHFGLNGVLGQKLIDCGINSKLITSFHGIDMYTHVYEFGNDIYTDLFQKGSLISANSNYSRNRLIDLGCNPVKLFVLPESLYITDFPFMEKKLNKPNQVVNFLTVARFVEKKGHIYALRAFLNVLRNKEAWHYYLIGDGPLRDEIEDFIINNNLQEHVTLVGSQPRDVVRQYFQKSHIFILPSVTAQNGDKEGQALVNQEAQAMGLPVISTIHNGIPEGVLDKQSGFLIPERDSNLLAERILWFLNNPESWRSFGKSGRNFVAAKYDTSKICQDLLIKYEEILNKN